MKTILIPTDFSEAAQNAVHYAIRLFGKDAHYVLVNAYVEPRSTTSSMISLSEVLHESSLDGLSAEKERVRSDFGQDVRLTAVSEYGESVSAIVTCVNRYEVDMIIMGTTGASGVKEVMIGSVASWVIQKASCPVLVVPNAFDYRTPKRILLAADLKSEKAFPTPFLDWLKALDPEITVLTVNEDAESVTESDAEHGYEVHVQLQGLKHGFEVIQSDNVEEAITDFAHANQIDLVLTIPRKASWFERILNPSVSRKLSQHLDIPVLSIS